MWTSHGPFDGHDFILFDDYERRISFANLVGATIAADMETGASSEHQASLSVVVGAVLSGEVFDTVAIVGVVAGASVTAAATVDVVAAASNVAGAAGKGYAAVVALPGVLADSNNVVSASASATAAVQASAVANINAGASSMMEAITGDASVTGAVCMTFANVTPKLKAELLTTCKC